MLCLPCLFVPPVGFLCIFTRLLTCSCMSLACKCVIHTSTQWSYGHSIQTYICPSQTPPFVRFLACLPFCLFACFLAPFFTMLIMLICFMPFRMLFASFPSMVSCFCLCMYTYGARTLGTRTQSPRRKKKRHGSKHVETSQAACPVDLGV